MPHPSSFFLRTFFAGTIFGLFLFVAPSHVFAACANPMQITNPPDGQNFVAPLPYTLKQTSIVFNIESLNYHYYLDLYQGVSGNAQLFAGHSERIAACTGNIAVDNDTLTQNGDYFYVLYVSDNVNLTSWRNHWATGSAYQAPAGYYAPDYTVSRFSVGSTRIPIVLVPGIGSAFNMDVLVKDKSPGSGSWNFLPGMPYDNFVKSLENAGYQKDKDLFVAYYDWRKSNDINAADNSVGAYLIPTIDKAKSLCGCSKVALVAHSMGGLAARSYMQSDLYSQRNDVSHLFLIGTPNQGSSNVYDLWEGGHIPINWDKAMVGGIYAYTWLAADDQLKGFDDTERYATIHRKISSVQQLLPTYNYLGYLSLGDIPRAFSGMIEHNPFLPILNQQTDFLSQRTNLYTFVGNNQLTVNNIPANPWTSDDGRLWVDGLPYPKDPVPNDTNGDNQVLLFSSELSQALQQYTYSDDHGKIVTDSAPDIAKILANASIPQPDPFTEPQNSLVYAVTSSADISITDPNGKTIGKSQNTIGDDAKYFSGSDPGDAKIVFINNPAAGNYQVNLQGEGTGGTFQMLAGSITQNGNASSVVQQNTITNSQTITYNSSYQSPADNSDTSITLTAADSTPPVISATTPAEQKYNRGDTITIDVSASDADSGVSSTTITLDGTIKQNGDTIDFSALSLGQHSLSIDAKDNAGNDAQQSITFTNTVTTQDIKKDIEKVASCGCISKKSVEQTLLSDTDAMSQAADADAKQTAVQNFSQFLNDKRGKAISEGAYQVLLQDSKWLQ